MNFGTMKHWYILLLLLISFLMSCKRDNNNIERKWKLEGSDVILQINADSTYTFIEHNNPKKGNWRMPDEKTILFSDNQATIQTLTDKELIIVMNDEEMKFQAE